MEHLANDTCNSSEETHNVIFLIKLIASSLSCLTNFVAVSIVFCGKGFCGGSYKQQIIRSILYLLIANFLLVTVQVLELLPASYGSGRVEVKEKWDNVCSIFGFLDQCAAWIRDLVVVFIVIQILIIIRNPANYREPQSVKSKLVEAVSVCFCFLFPFTFNWIPFLDDYYGLSGHWCWIKLIVKNCDENVVEGLLYMMILYYCPLVMIVIITSLLCLYIVYKWCTSQKKHLTIILVILYPIIFDALCLIMFANRLDSALRIKSGREPLYFLWILHSLADSGRTLLPPLLVILLLSCRTSRLVLMPRSGVGCGCREGQDDEQAHLVQPSHNGSVLTTDV